VRRLIGRDPILIYPGVDTSSFRPESKRPLSGRPVRLATVSAFAPYRRFEDVIRAVSILNRQKIPTELYLAGNRQLEPAYYERLRGLVSELQLEDRVIFAGPLSEAALRDFYRDSDIFCWPNHNQSWGLAVFEAMASGTPVIVSRTAGASEVLKDKVDAMIVEALRPDAIAHAVEELVVNEALRRRITEAGARLCKEMTWSAHAQSMMDVIDELVTQRNRE
jgi:glycosyltransferase involved in cell wall biosynthesis